MCETVHVPGHKVELQVGRLLYILKVHSDKGATVTTDHVVAVSWAIFELYRTKNYNISLCGCISIVCVTQ